MCFYVYHVHIKKFTQDHISMLVKNTGCTHSTIYLTYIHTYRDIFIIYNLCKHFKIIKRRDYVEADMCAS